MKQIRYVIIAIIVLVVCFGASKTYSYYIDEASGLVDYSIASWVIKVNDTDITTEEVREFTIGDLIVDHKDSVKDTKMAPGSTGYFNIRFDLSEVDTGVVMELALDKENLESYGIILKNHKTSYGNLDVDDETGMFKESLNYAEVNAHNQILVTFEFEWVDEEENNERDSAIGSIPNNSVVLPVTVSVYQKTE